MIRTLFHGSSVVVGRPVFGKGKPYNDYGLGFYCTEVADLAREWAVGPARDGFVNCYELDCEGLSVLDLNGGGYCILHWLALLLENRTFDISSPLAVEARDYITSRFHINLQPYDAIVGYRADDSYFSFAQDFIGGAISLRQLSGAMHLGKLGEQFVLKSARTFERVVVKGFEAVSADEWYARRSARDVRARHEYLDVERYARRKGDLFIAQIIDEEMGPGDERLR